MDPQKYKAFHEAAMSNNSGTTPEHTLLCIFLAVLSSAMVVIGRRNRSHRFQLLVEYTGFVLPMVVAYTVLASNIIEVTKLVIGLIYIQSAYHLHRINILRAFKYPNVFTHNRMECITNFRGMTYLMTIFCILAVDFASFPRILAKTERYGYSLMDTGVGLFTVGSGLVHRSYAMPQISIILKDNYKLLMVPALGIARTVLIKWLDYHEHVTEYGVHWNFFYTLAIAKFTSMILLHYTSNVLMLPLCGAVLIAHQTLLWLGLEKWVFSDIARDNFLTANREGIVSSLGYVSLYLFGVYIKTVLMDRTIIRGVVLSKLSILWVLSFVVMFRTSLLSPVSRTLANAGYCIFIVAIFMVIIILFYIVEVILHDYGLPSVPIIAQAFNNNGLFLFVLGNVLTGLVNIMCQTLLVKPWPTVAILNTYTTFLLWVAVFLNKRGIVLL